MNEVKYLDETGLGTVWTKVKGIVTPKADKVSSATNGHLAGLNASGNLTDSGVVASNVALKDGSYSQMTVGTAEDLASTQSVASEFTYRVTGGSTSVGKGGTEFLDRVKGRTVVWNQLGCGNLADKEANILTTGFSYVQSAGYYEATSYSSPWMGANTVNFVGGHVYLITMDYIVTSGNHSATIFAYNNSTTANQGEFVSSGTNDIRINRKKIFTATAASNGYPIVFVQFNGTTSAKIYSFCIYDLTLMFGAGNEPSTFTDFENLYPLPSYKYNPGVLVNNGHRGDYDLTWNQLCQTNWFASASSNQITFTNNGDGSYTINGTANAATRIYGYTTRTSYSNHKYCLMVSEPSIGLYLDGSPANSGSLTVSKQIVVTSSSATYRPTLNIASGYSFSNKKIYIRIHDLTAMFGAGNEPTTAAEFEDMFPLSYYPYDAGTQQSFHFPQFETNLKTVGFNLWDEEWESGTINDSDGNTATNASYIRSKNFILALPSTEYYKTTNARVFFYDAGKGYLGYTPTNAAGTFTTPSGTRFMKLRINYASPYNHDICINFSDASRNGTYEPHWEETAALNLGDFKVKSPNIWDEDWELGIYDSNGEKSAANDRIRSANYIAVSPNTSYYFKLYASSSVICWYDSSYNLISRSSYTENDVRTSPANAAYCTFFCGSGYGTAYNHDICICESGHGHDGKYYPYGTLTIQGGLKSAGTVYDEISDGKFIQRVGSANLGALTWISSSYNYGTLFNGNIPDMRSTTDVNLRIDGIKTTKYYLAASGYSFNELPDKNYMRYDKYICIKDSAYTAAQDFAAANNGIFAYYELATPEDFDLLTPIDTAIRNDPYGTEQRIPADTAGTVLAPFRADITYSTNIKEAVEHLDENFISVASMTDFLTALNEQMNGTWSMIFKDGKYHFSFTANPEEQATL